MADEEISAVKAHVEVLSRIPVTFPDEYTSDPQDWPRKFTPFPIELPPPPIPQSSASPGAQVESITLTIKSTKPALSFNLHVQLTDTIASIKEKLGSQYPRAPPPEVQRLLIKGKVLADNKLLKEYDGIADGAVLNLMVKPGVAWTGEERIISSVGAANPAVTEERRRKLDQPPHKHSRIPSEGGAADQYSVPSLVLVTPSSPTAGLRRPVPLTLDTSAPSRPPSPLSATDTGTYSEKISSIGFWINLREFLCHEFMTEQDADAAFESFLIASKGSLSAGDIALIRDTVGLTGMAGT
ncbi:hypothetical protein BS47DRAFT_1373442 [Hydnum rufescens UP504]|uniref:Ubiquitin-like domain-containing protein n=1 Tax=Hydnum rufescens UP504 TaxID=1448309 RepID=A0A9P6APM3_9AGAM|nr:hypothetical protein BS47DRAFT_1373442 [Hydnum rufescens UP504]